MFGSTRSSSTLSRRPKRIAFGAALCLTTFISQAEPPIATYIFPAGAQRGTSIEARVGGLYFHGKAQFHLEDPSIKVLSEIREIPTVYFESPLITRPDSQRGEDYPKDHAAKLNIPSDALLGLRRWHCETDQGTTPDQQFVIGPFPEITEHEIEGRPVPMPVTLPVTVNGRIFPREDVDLWSFEAEAGETITCQVRSHRLGYPLEAILDILDEKNQPVPSTSVILGGDPELNFTAPQSGQYQVRITDANFSGLQNYVYRLTLRRGHRVVEYSPLGGKAGTPVDVTGVLSDGSHFKSKIKLPERSGLVPVSIRNVTALLPFHIAPKTATLFHGQIDSSGKTDHWKIEATKGESLVLDVVAHSLQSRLDAVITVLDPTGKIVGENDDRSGTEPDPHHIVTVSEDGTYEIRVRDKFESRGGQNFGYLLVVQRRTVDYQISTTTHLLNVPRRSPADLELEKPPPTPSLPIALKRYGGFQGPVRLQVFGLPNNVEVTGTEIDAKSNGASLKFLTQPGTPFATANLSITATARSDDDTTISRSLGSPVRLSIVPKVPFKHVGYYRITNEQPAGSVLVRDYELQRFDEFDGPIWVSLADRSVRHLQGVHGPVIKVPAGTNRFEYPVHFGTVMEMNRTCRMQLMLVGEVDGKTVSYTTANVNDQIIAVTAESLLSVAPNEPTVTVAPGSQIAIPINVGRNIVLARSPVTVSARVPPHFSGVTAEAVTISPGEHSGELVVKLSPDTNGPFNMPLPIHAKASDNEGLPHAAIGSVELVLKTNTLR